MSGPAPVCLPALPTKYEDWIQYITTHPEQSLEELNSPFKAYESEMRSVFAQHPNHPAIAKPNVVPVFAGHEDAVKIRARDLSVDADKYIMPLKDKDRKASGESAIVHSLKEFQTNFQLFSESSLVDLDWSNIVVAGSAVTTSILTIPEEHRASKRAQRNYYHQIIAPASDVDIFIYGLNEEQAMEKIKQIEQRVKDSILTETTTVRTKHAITICSQYPTRHVQIVLRLYRSISEILTGFDVDCSCLAYDGQQIYASSRALVALMTQVNSIDLTRRSPSYENRLSKYSRRGFEVYWPDLDRSRIDPTLFERSFGRTLGLARLLVLEKLPRNQDREAYVDKRRAERGRPAINRWKSRKLAGNMKDEHDDEVAEWVETDTISDYHTFTLPYGPKYQARKIERLLYAKDLLLNAEWNKPKDRDTDLHRHPAFFGDAADVMGDCCGHCPKAVTPEDKTIEEEESKIYVSGQVSFIKDDPGRQSIGSFNPLTKDDWTEMAYVGNTAGLCQAIIDEDIERVKEWLAQEDADPNRRDYTGKTPLHLATTSSTVEIVQCLLDAGARVTARIFDGNTVLHLAALRGNVEIVKAILVKSNANQQKADEEEIARKAVAGDEEMKDLEKGVEVSQISTTSGDDEVDGEASGDSDIDMMSDVSTEKVGTTTEASMVKISQPPQSEVGALETDNDDEPDILDINVLSWDIPASALHLAIVKGHTSVVELMVGEFGASVSQPVKLLNNYNKSARASILPLALALSLPSEQAKDMVRTLVRLGASYAQADVAGITALQYFSGSSYELLSALCAEERPRSKKAMNNVAMLSMYSTCVRGCLHAAIEKRDCEAVRFLLELGVNPSIEFGTYMNTVMKSGYHSWITDTDYHKKEFGKSVLQPVLAAIEHDIPSIVPILLDSGADVNTLSPGAHYFIDNQTTHYNMSVYALLDAVRNRIAEARKILENEHTKEYTTHTHASIVKPLPLEKDTVYLSPYEPGSYAHWVVSLQLEQAKLKYSQELKTYTDHEASRQVPEGMAEKCAAVREVLTELENLEMELVERGAKTFQELHKDLKPDDEKPGSGYRCPTRSPERWQPNLTFQLPDITDKRQQAYIRLFEACWSGDMLIVKQLSLAVWGDGEPPLQIAVRDSAGLSPFSIAVLRGHLEVATVVLDISHAQYAPEEEVRRTHRVGVDTDEDEDEGSEANSDDGIPVCSEEVVEEFEFDAQHIQTTVKCSITPLELMSWRCPADSFVDSTEEPDDETDFAAMTGWNRFSTFGYGSRFPIKRRASTGGRAPRKMLKRAAEGIVWAAPVVAHEWHSEAKKPKDVFQFAIFLNDASLLEALLSLGEKFAALSLNPDVYPSKFYVLSDDDLLYAIKLSRIDLLPTMIRRTGVGLPLDDLATKYGVELPEQPTAARSYKGLTVHGRKRADWANAGRDNHAVDKAEAHPPLLHAARSGSAEAMLFFGSEAATAAYIEFCTANASDPRIASLAKAKGGFQGVVRRWLDLRDHLLLHCVVLGKVTESSQKILKQLCEAKPDLMNKRSASGLTPLHLTFALRKPEFARILLEAGADVTTRDVHSKNLLHSLLSPPLSTKTLEAFLPLLPAKALEQMSVQRSNVAPGSATPLAAYLHATYTRGYNPTIKDHNTGKEVISLILSHTGTGVLSFISGAGDTPLHMAASMKTPMPLATMLEARPELLHRENATGRTPAEVVEDAALKHVFAGPPNIGSIMLNQFGHQYRNASRGILDTEAKKFKILTKDEEEEKNIEEEQDVGALWRVVEAFGDKAGTKRKLVSLVEASEVARRLSHDVSKKRTKRGAKRFAVDEDEDEGGNVKGDEVDRWFNMGLEREFFNRV